MLKSLTIWLLSAPLGEISIPVSPPTFASKSGNITLNAFDRDDELDGEELFFNDDGGELSRKSSKAYSQYKADLIKASSIARRKRIRENNNGVDLNSLFAKILFMNEVKKYSFIKHICYDAF